MTVNRIVYLVLYCLEELLCHFHSWVIVDTEGVNLQHLAIEHLLTGADVTDSCKQLVKVIATSSSLQQVIIHGEAFHNILLQDLGCPYTELNATVGMNTITYADNHVEVVEGYYSFNLASSFILNCCKICNSCLFL